MIKYRCPECGASCNTSHCYDCDIDIPMSQRFDDATESGPSKEYKPIKNVSYHDTAPNTSARYKCPECGAICQTSYCFVCEKDLSFAARCDSVFSTPRKLSTTLSSIDFDRKVGSYFAADSHAKRFKFSGDGSYYSFDSLLNFELCEDNAVVMRGGVGRALVGGALFGEVGAIVGAGTRKSANVVNSLYIRLTLKGTGMKKISFINTPTDKNGLGYKGVRCLADEVISELELIVSDNQSAAAQAAAQQSIPQPATSHIQQPCQTERSPTLIADELLKLKQLLDMGVLTQEEFDLQKQKLLNS